MGERGECGAHVHSESARVRSSAVFMQQLALLSELHTTRHASVLRAREGTKAAAKEAHMAFMGGVEVWGALSPLDAQRQQLIFSRAEQELGVEGKVGGLRGMGRQGSEAWP